jgi:hypothetical protein
LSGVRAPEGALKSSGFADRELRGWGFYFVWIYAYSQGFDCLNSIDGEADAWMVSAFLFWSAIGFFEPPEIQKQKAESCKVY